MAKVGREKEGTWESYDYSLLFLTIFLACFGLVMIYSSSSYIAEIKYKDAAYFLKRQGIAIVLGSIAMLVISRVDYRVFLKPLPWKGINLTAVFYVFALLLQLYTLFFGIKINEARRWISLGPLGTIQPSELTKVAVILFVADLIYKRAKILERMRGFVYIILFVSPAIALIGKENMSTALVIMGITFVMCFVASRKKAYFFGCAGAAVGGIIAIINSGWRSKRVEIWRNVETSEKAFQIRQGLYAIASGGLFGTGLGESMQKLGFIPEAYNDMIFTVICEELGLVGASAVILLFLLLILRIFKIAINTNDLFGAMICTGVMAHISIQVIMNVLVVTNSIPSTGIPLPLISYGGSSVIFLLMEMGIVLNISRNVGRSQMAALNRNR